MQHMKRAHHGKNEKTRCRAAPSLGGPPACAAGAPTGVRDVRSTWQARFLTRGLFQNNGHEPARLAREQLVGQEARLHRGEGSVAAAPASEAGSGSQHRVNSRGGRGVPAPFPERFTANASEGITWREGSVSVLVPLCAASSGAGARPRAPREPRSLPEWGCPGRHWAARHSAEAFSAPTHANCFHGLAASGGSRGVGG